MSTVVAFFNNKGGVGKTTLACNFAAWEAAAGRSVLIVDLDPQCNSTQLVLNEDQWEAIYEGRGYFRTSGKCLVMRSFRCAEGVC